jgi:lysophospholipase L1-like esterase
MSGATGNVAGAPAPNRIARMAGGHFALSVVTTVLLVVALVAMDLLALALNNPAKVLQNHYFMALGNSISFGYQPNLNFTSGYVDDLFTDLAKANVTDEVNYACAGESTATMIHGGCPGHLIHHNAYQGPQLDAAVSFIQQHPGQVNPITLELGSNDVLPDWNETTCAPSDGAAADLATLDANLTQTILPRLLAALGPAPLHQVVDVVLLNYYNPFVIVCPASTDFAHELNNHLAADAAQFRISVVDVYAAFGGDAGMADTICGNPAKGIPAYTWMCNNEFHDLHPTNDGYRAIANAVEHALGYPGLNPNGINPVPNLAPATGWRPRDQRRDVGA